MVPMLSGSAYRRPGTLHTDDFSITSDYAGRLFPFIVSKTEQYALLMSKVVGGAMYIKSYRPVDNATVSNCTTAVATYSTGKTDMPYVFATASTSGSPADDEIREIQYVQSADVLYLVHKNQKPQIVRRYAPYLTTPYFVISDYDTDSTGTILTGQARINSRPYRNMNSTLTTITPDATNGTWVSAGIGSGVKLTASTGIFTPDDVGSIYIHRYSGTVGAIEIYEYLSTTEVRGTTLANFGAASASAAWWESAWSPKRGWPRACTIFQQRLCFAGNLAQPDTIWFTGTGNYGLWSVLGTTIAATTAGTNGAITTIAGGQYYAPDDSSQGDGFSTGPIGIQPFRITLSQTALDYIQWLSPDKELLVGTLSQEWIVAPQSGAFDVGNSLAQQQSKYGSDYLQPQRIGYELIFATAAQNEVRAYQYNFVDSSFFAEPVQLLFDEYPKAEKFGYGIGRRRFRNIEWDQSRQTLWCLDTAGNFFGMTRDRKLGVTMWHTHKFGGYDETQGYGVFISYGANATNDSAYYIHDGQVVSFTVVPNPLSGLNDIWLLIKRTINGTVRWHVERMIGRMSSRETAYASVEGGLAFPGYTMNEPTMVDSAFVQLDPLDGLLTFSVPHLEGESFVGNYYGQQGIFKISGSVASGVATITSSVPTDYGDPTSAGGMVVIGLPYNPIIKPVRVDAGSVIGTSQSAIKRINRVFLRLYKSMHVMCGSTPDGEDLSALESLYFNTGAEDVGDSPEIVSKDVPIIIPSTYDRDGYIYITQESPLPLNITAIVMEGQEFDGGN